MTTQEAYEQIRAYFTRPGAALAQEGGGCFYRLGKNAAAPVRCAIGCLIPDDAYRPEWDNDNTTLDRIIDAVPELEGVALPFLDVAQETHDCAADVEDFLYELGELARMHDLVVA